MSKSPIMQDFSDFLEQQAFGGQLDSQGTFTVGQKEAVKKLAEMALENPSYWVLKAVQAAVAGGCPQIRFQLARRTTRVLLLGVEPDLEQLQLALLNPSLDAEPYLKELFVGLRTLLFHHRFRMRTSQGEWLAWDGESFQHGKLSDISTPPADNGLELLVENSGGQRARDSRDYGSLLRERALFAPLRLYLDGSEITPERELAAPTPDFGVDAPWYTAPLLFARYRFGEEKQAAQALKQATGSVFRDPLLSTEKEFLSVGVGEPKGRTSCHLTLRFPFQDRAGGEDKPLKRLTRVSPFKVVLTRHGVVCLTRETKNSEIGGVLHFPCDRGRSDLSGLRLREPKDFRKRVQGIEPFLEVVINAISNLRPRMHVHSPDSGRWKAGFAMAGGAAGLLTMALGGAPLLIAKIATAAGTAGGVSLTSVRVDNFKHRRVFVDALRGFQRSLSSKF